MSWYSNAWDKTKGYASDAYGYIDDAVYGGNLPGGGADDRSDNEYAGIGQGNYQMPGIPQPARPPGAPPGGGGGSVFGRDMSLGGMTQGMLGKPSSGYDQFQNRYTDYLGQTDNRQAPTIGEYERAQQSGFRGNQEQLAGLLMDRANGKNSLAEQHLRGGVEQANQANMAMMAGARPSNAGMAMRLGTQGMNRNIMGLSGATALARTNEANQAAMGLGNVLAQGRGADEQLGMFNAGQTNNRQLSQAQMDQNQMAMNDQQRMGLLGLSQGAANTQLGANMALEQNRTDRAGLALGVPTRGERYQAYIQQGLKFGGGGLGGGLGG